MKCLSELNEFVDYFVIVESKYTHQGGLKKNFLNLSDFKKFQDKIIYIYNEDKIGKNNAWEQENFQRNLINKGIIDPVLVTKTALKNAVSVVNTIFSANCVISNVRVENASN